MRTLLIIALLSSGVAMGQHLFNGKKTSTIYRVYQSDNAFMQVDSSKDGYNYSDVKGRKVALSEGDFRMFQMVSEMTRYDHQRRDFFLLITELIRGYKAECWADSTCHEGNISCPHPECNLEPKRYCDGSFGCWDNPRWTGCKYLLHYWTHREPTFEGFMKYIEQRSK